MIMEVYAVVTSQTKNALLNEYPIIIKPTINPQTFDTENEHGVMNCLFSLSDAKTIMSQTKNNSKYIIGFIIDEQSYICQEITAKIVTQFIDTKITKIKLANKIFEDTNIKNFVSPFVIKLEAKDGTPFTINYLIISDPTCIIKAFDPEPIEKQTVNNTKKQKPTTQHVNSNYQNINKPPIKAQAPPPQQKPIQSQIAEPSNSNNQNKHNQDQVFNVFNKVYNFFIHIPKWIWLLIGVLLGSFIGWAMHGLIERYSFPCIIISFMLLVIAILIVILLAILICNRNKPNQ